jgi:hypothetical protein
MKILITSLAAVFALAIAAQAEDVTAKISNVHLCCKKCVTLAEKSVDGVTGAKATVDKDAGTVSIAAPDKATAQKAADALVADGFFGTSSDVTLNADTGAKDEKVKSLEIKGLHLCCDKCVKAVDKTVMAVPGVTGQTAKKGAETFTVTGDFNAKDLMAALQKEGLTGKVTN